MPLMELLPTPSAWVRSQQVHGHASLGHAEVTVLQCSRDRGVPAHNLAEVVFSSAVLSVAMQAELSLPTKIVLMHWGNQCQHHNAHAIPQPARSLQWSIQSGGNAQSPVAAVNSTAMRPVWEAVDLLAVLPSVQVTPNQPRGAAMSRPARHGTIALENGELAQRRAVTNLVLVRLRGLPPVSTGSQARRLLVELPNAMQLGYKPQL
jgi:hypothetical protein